MSHAPIRLLSLGDSYTIGESVDVQDRWPLQLASTLEDRGAGRVTVEIVARTGWTTSQLDAGIDASSSLEGTFDLVSLQIGVNNQYRGLPIDEYREEFAALLERAIGFAGGEPGRVVVVSIPDWGVIPSDGGGPSAIGDEIDAFNAVNREAAESAGARWIDVTAISRSGDAGMIADDGLHPSAEQYARWVEVILPAAENALRDG